MIGWGTAIIGAVSALVCWVGCCTRARVRRDQADRHDDVSCTLLSVSRGIEAARRRVPAPVDLSMLSPHERAYWYGWYIGNGVRHAHIPDEVLWKTTAGVHCSS